MVMSIKGDYFLNIDDQTLTSSLEYDIPDEAVGIKVKGCYWRDPNWPDNQPDVLIPQISVQDLTNQNAGLWNYMAFYLQDNKIILTNTQSGMTLRTRYYRRASKLVPNDEGAQILDSSTANIVCTTIPTDWAVGDVLTLTNQNPPFDTISRTLEITGITLPNIVNLLQTDPDAPILTQSDMDGNWLTQADETVIAQVPPEAHPILAQAVAVKCLEALGDPNVQVAQLKFEQLKNNFISMLTPRVDGYAKRITQRNGTLLWNKVSRWRGWNW